MLAGLRRRGWAGRLVWAFAPVQDRRAAPLITRALQDLAAVGQVDVIVVARGGGSVMDLMAFSDETLCRTVALLSVPVVASVGHHTDRTLIDDVAPVSCSTPTHAAEAAVRLHCGDARRSAAAAAATPGARRAARGSRARTQAHRAVPCARRAPCRRTAPHAPARARAAGSRRAAGGRGDRRHAAAAARAAAPVGAAGRRRGREQPLARGRARELRRATGATLARRARDLERLSLALAAHDPERTLERGYALVERPDGQALTTAGAAREESDVWLRFADGRVGAHIDPEEES